MQHHCLWSSYGIGLHHSPRKHSETGGWEYVLPIHSFAIPNAGGGERHSERIPTILVDQYVVPCLSCYDLRVGNVALTRILVAGCNAALVPQEYDFSGYDNSSSTNSSNTGVTYDTSSYADIASRGAKVVQHCVSNTTEKSSGGWVTAGRPPHLRPSVRITKCSCKR